MNNILALVKKHIVKYKMIEVVLSNKEVLHFSLTKGQFKNYINSFDKLKDIYVSLSYNEDDYRTFSSYISYKVDTLNSVKTIRDGNFIDLYVNVSSKDYISYLLTKDEYKMFMDYEFTMPSASSKDKNFKIEIIQAGIVILDNKDKIVYEYSNYIKTKYKLTERCKRFLDIEDEVLEDSIDQERFYKDFKEIINIYNPSCFTWGGSDDAELNDFYKLNKFKPIKINSFDLSELIKKYYNLPENIGLFRALKIFRDINVIQAHHALTDAVVTKEIYEAFKKDINNPTINVIDKLNKIKEEEKALKEEKKQLRLLKNQTKNIE